MQTQDAPAELVYKLWPWLEENRYRLAAAGAIILIVVGGYYYLAAQRQQREISAGEAFTDALVQPSVTLGDSATILLKISDTYPGTEAAKRAQLQAAASLYGAGQYAEAQVQFQKFLDNGVSGPLAATAQLGIGACLEAQGKPDQAATAYQRVVSSYPGQPSALPAYCGLGRIAESQGRLNEALNDYGDAVRVGQNNSMAQSAYISGQAIKAKLNVAPKPAAAAANSAPAAAPSIKPTLILPSK
jgi:predicted negative regulator of RcsB-dependent stress response